jgi:glycosyltransferase involved in cell wall biosynthesis
LIFDVRGLMAEEYVDAGRWQREGLPYRLTRWVQRAALRRADGMVVLTHAVRPRLVAERAGRDANFVIPCCADLDRLEDRARERESVRAELEIGDRPVMVYAGKFTGWYMEREMADFFAVARRSLPELLFLVLTQADPAPMLNALERNGLGAGDYRVLRAEPDEIGRYLAAADFGISFIRPSFSKISSSPTKVGEYLGAGLPVVSSAGIGDVDALLRDNGVGVLVEDFSGRGYEVAARAIAELMADPAMSERCRAVAREELSLREVGIPRYDELYRRVALSREPT